MTKTPLIERLNWRYATKKMDPAKPVSEDKVAQIVEAIQLAPTSSGTQPFELFVITNPETRAEIRKVAWDQTPITDGSHLLVFAAWDNYTAERIDAVTDQLKAERGDLPLLTAYYDNLKNTYLPRDASVNHDHAARQAYIALGLAMAAAAELEVDATPMEGFDPDKVDEILGLKDKGLRSVVIMPLGHREEGADWLLPMPKMRKPLEKLVTRLD
ncbi:NAD(P)H-dependent oxidoreductase [Lentibacter algarum]|uniref:NAD(P)H-dependent oxidoreductase n=1 Tax=Lentibacter algarum TaxID=576131 RepID=UPI001C07AFFB|nr:NAD(P)H-dependent oxidoreductase [Lentibacter algarum]MBU2981270.1 NAD(P)H-dependent oxidoreductase [Lentibacter algarum]